MEKTVIQAFLKGLKTVALAVLAGLIGSSIAYGLGLHNHIVLMGISMICGGLSSIPFRTR